MKKVKLGEVIYLNMGQSPESDSYNSERQGIPFFQGNADFGKINPLVRLWCNKPTKIAKKNDILLSVRAPIGAINIANCECCIGRGLCAITPREKIISSKYLYFGLMGLKNYLISKGTGSTFKAINKNILLEAEIPLPSVEEQKEIADRLDKVSSLIEKRKTQLSKLDQLIKSRFIELMGCAELSEEITIEQITERVKVGFVGTCEKYYTDASGIPMLRTGNITDHGIDMSDLKYVTAEFHEKNKKSQIKSGDLLIARHGSNGQANVYVGSEAQCLNAVVIVPNPAIAKSVFLAGLINSPNVKEQIDRTLVGSTQHVVNTKSIANLVVRIPQLIVQEQYEVFVEQVNKSKLAIQKSFDKLETLKKSLMQQYFG